MEFAAAGHFVVSNSRNHRMDALVPLLIPEVNPEHLALIPLQKKTKGWSGAIVTNPNCAAVPLVMALAALRAFQPKRVLITTLQGLSGAGYPGVASLDATANVIPFIDGEEQKIVNRAAQNTGALRGGRHRASSRDFERHEHTGSSGQRAHRKRVRRIGKGRDPERDT